MDEIAELFALPLDEFTAARNELARRLKREGRDDAAEEVRALTKPSVAAWAVNQLARQEAEGVRSLLNVGARLRSAQERSLKGDRAADEIRAAQSEEREVVRTLTQRAAEILRAAGRRPSGTTLDRVSSTLRAAALSQSTRELLREGRLTGDVEVSGFEALEGLQVPRARRRAAAKEDDLAERRRQKREAERRRRELEKRVRELTARAEKAERAAERARKEADEAEAVAVARRRDADDAVAELEQLTGSAQR